VLSGSPADPAVEGAGGGRDGKGGIVSSATGSVALAGDERATSCAVGGWASAELPSPREQASRARRHLFEDIMIDM
jgi:hypothetical protein